MAVVRSNQLSCAFCCCCFSMWMCFVLLLFHSTVARGDSNICSRTSMFQRNWFFRRCLRRLLFVFFSTRKKTMKIVSFVNCTTDIRRFVHMVIEVDFLSISLYLSISLVRKNNNIVKSNTFFLQENCRAAVCRAARVRIDRVCACQRRFRPRRRPTVRVCCLLTRIINFFLPFEICRHLFCFVFFHVSNYVSVGVYCVRESLATFGR